MKQLIRIGVLMGLLTASIPLLAQVAQRDSDSRKGSRLELGRSSGTTSPTTNRLPNQRFTMVPRPGTSTSDKSITVNKNAAINEHYRSVLIPSASNASKSSARTGNEGVASADSRTASVPEKTESRLFANDKIWVSNAYPNPADEAAEIDYQITGAVGEAKLSLLNILGSPVAGYEQIDLDRGDRKVRIVTRPLDTGYYLYQLTVDGKKVATKRLLVRHQ